MARLTYVALIQRNVTEQLTGVTDLDIRPNASGTPILYATSRSGETISIFEIGASGSVNLYDNQSLNMDTEEIEFMTIGGIDYAVTLGPQGGASQLYQLNTAGQITGGATSLPATPAGMNAMAVVETDGGTYLYYVGAGGSQALGAFQVNPGMTLTPVTLPDSITGVSRLAQSQIGDTDYLLAVTDTGSQIISYSVQNNGTLTARGEIGAAQGLGLAGISDLKQVSLPDGDYVVVAARDSSSLSILRLEDDGSLTPVDHIIDDLNTRFQNVTALETVTVGTRVFVLAGGADDGISLFELLPGGRLLLQDTVIDDFDMTLENVSALTATEVNGVLQVFVGSATETGITQFSVDLGPIGTTRYGTNGNDNLTGSSAGEVLSGREGNDRVDGWAGDDILLDGAGRDSLRGGAGADIFVLEADATLDVILDFDPALDRIDLSAWPMLRNIGQITFAATANGAQLSFGDEVLRIISAAGQPFSAQEILVPNVIGVTRVPASVPAPPPPTPTVITGNNNDNLLVGNILGNLIRGLGGTDTLSGGDGADTLLGGPGSDLLIGGVGRDLVSYGGAGAGLLADLQFAFANTGEAAGDTYAEIEDIEGSAYDDDLRGNAANNQVIGGAGNDFLYGRDGDDTLLGGAGNDILVGGAGADVLNGGAGWNRISYWTSSVDLLADLQFTFVNTGIAAGDSYVGIQDIQGSAGNDEIRGNNYNNNIWGNAGNDVLYGRDGDDRLFGYIGDDTLLGNKGADLLNGGDGIDRASYWTATAGVTADLLTPTVNTGEAAGDTYVQIEDLQGSSYDDILRGDNAANGIWGAAGDDMIVGRGGNDYLEGHVGRDTLDGGAGDDTLRGGGDADTFIFNEGRDVIQDFWNDIDQIQLDAALWGGQSLSALQIISTYASVTNGNTVLDFGNGNTLTINSLANPDLLADDLLIV